jgi:hypothetical protein
MYYLVHSNNQQFTNNELLLIIILMILIFYIIYHFANCPVYQYSHATSIVSPKLIKPVNIPSINMSPININKEKQKNICDSICNNGRPRCDIDQSNSENYSNCVDDLTNYIDCGCNKNQI